MSEYEIIIDRLDRLAAAPATPTTLTDDAIVRHPNGQLMVEHVPAYLPSVEREAKALGSLLKAYPYIEAYAGHIDGEFDNALTDVRAMFAAFRSLVARYESVLSKQKSVASPSVEEDSEPTTKFNMATDQFYTEVTEAGELYRCQRCTFATINAQAFATHWSTVHGPEFAESKPAEDNHFTSWSSDLLAERLRSVGEFNDDESTPLLVAAAARIEALYFGTVASHPAGEGAPTDVAALLAEAAEAINDEDINRLHEAMIYYEGTDQGERSAILGGLVYVIQRLGSSLRSARDRIGGLEWEVDGLESDIAKVVAERDAALSRVAELERERFLALEDKYQKALAEKLEWFATLNGRGVVAFADHDNAALSELLASVQHFVPSACHEIIGACIVRLRADEGAFLKLREEVEALPHDAWCDNTLNAGPCNCNRSRVLSLLDRATTTEPTDG